MVAEWVAAEMLLMVRRQQSTYTPVAGPGF